MSVSKQQRTQLKRYENRDMSRVSSWCEYEDFARFSFPQKKKKNLKTAVTIRARHARPIDARKLRAS